MIISVEELRTHITTDKTNEQLGIILDGIESLILQYTNNNFINRMTGAVQYPASVKLAVVDIVAWKLRNEKINSGEKVHSESISRHSVTYATDASETDIDDTFGVPKKFTAVFKLYKKARF